MKSARIFGQQFFYLRTGREGRNRTFFRSGQGSHRIANRIASQSSCSESASTGFPNLESSATNPPVKESPAAVVSTVFAGTSSWRSRILRVKLTLPSFPSVISRSLTGNCFIKAAAACSGSESPVRKVASSSESFRMSACSMARRTCSFMSSRSPQRFGRRFGSKTMQIPRFLASFKRTKLVLREGAFRHQHRAAKKEPALIQNGKNQSPRAPASYPLRYDGKS